jgi:hypothetical protein
LKFLNYITHFSLSHIKQYEYIYNFFWKLSSETLFSYFLASMFSHLSGFYFKLVTKYNWPA